MEGDMICGLYALIKEVEGGKRLPTKVILLLPGMMITGYIRSITDTAKWAREQMVSSESPGDAINIISQIESRANELLLTSAQEGIKLQQTFLLSNVEMVLPINIRLPVSPYLFVSYNSVLGFYLS